MQNKDPDWIFFEFFQKLKKEIGIDLSLSQYQLFLHIFLSKPITDVDEVRFLLETLWLTKDKYRLEFDRLFNETIRKPLVLPLQLPTTNENIIQKPEPTIEATSSENDKSKINEKPPEIKTPIDENINKVTTETLSKNREINININDIGGRNTDFSDQNISPTSNFILSEYKYLPFDSRAMEQGWRKMRGKTKYVVTDNLDIKNIIKLKSQQGFIENVLYEKKSKGIQKIIWFTDNGGSMAPFAFWDEQLFEIMKNVPNTDKVERFFFHDFPSEKLNRQNKKDYLFFTNRSHSQTKFLSEIIKPTDKNTIFIVCSDGGAARKRDDMERVNVFFDVCNIIRSKSRNIGWINPVKNLNMSSGKYISFFVKTEYPSNKGISKLLQNT